jgi:hypothetical protein
MTLLNSEYGIITHIECGIVPYTNDVTELVADDRGRAENQFSNFFKMPDGGTSFELELDEAPLDCPFKTQSFGSATLNICGVCPQRIEHTVNTVVFTHPS